MSAPATVRELAAALGVSIRAVQTRAASEQWPADKASKEHRYTLEGLPSDARAAVLALRRQKAQLRAEAAEASRRAAEIAHKWEVFQLASKARRDRAEQRAAFLVQVAELVKSGASVERAITAASSNESAGVPVRTAIRWRSDVKGLPREHWPAFLLPEERNANRKAEVHPAAWAWFKADYLRPERPTVAMCYERLTKAAAQHHPEWLPLPSLRTVNRMVRELPQGAVVYAREGPQAAERIGPRVVRSVEALEVMEEWNADGHECDVRVSFPDGSIGRPCLLAVQDIASRMIVGYRIGKAETAELVRLAFSDAFTRWGLPQRVRLDNGRAFAAHAISGHAVNRKRWKDSENEWAGMFAKLGVTAHFVTPYRGQAKPVERAFQDIRDRITADERCKGACTGNDPLNKPHNYGSAVVPWETFQRVMADAIADHNARPGRRGGICKGRSFAETFNAMYQQTAVRKATAAQLRVLLLSQKAAKVNQVARVQLFGNEYWSKPLSQLIGTRVVLHFDPDALAGGVYVYTAEGTFVCHAESPIVVGHSKKEDHDRATREHRALNRERREYNQDVKKNAPAIPFRDRSWLDHGDAAKPEPAAVIPLRAKQSKPGTVEGDQTPAQVIELPTITHRRRAR